MSLVIYTREGSRLNVTDGASPPVGGYNSQGCKAEANGNLATHGGSNPVTHQHNGLSFQEDGRVSRDNGGTIDHYHNGLPYAVDGRLVCGGGGDGPTYVHNGVPFNEAGKVYTP